MARSKEQHGAAQDATHGEQHRTAPHCTGRPTTKNLGAALTPDRQKFPCLVQIYIDNSRRNVSLEVTVPQTFSRHHTQGGTTFGYVRLRARGLGKS